MENRNKIVIFNILSTVVIQGLAFFSGPIFSGMLGTSNYGVASVYLTWVQIASTVYSLQAAGTVALARVNFSAEEQKAYQSSVLSLATLCYLFFSFLTIFLVFFLNQWHFVNKPMLLLGLAHGWGLYVVGFMNSKFTYEFKAVNNFVLSVCTSFLTIATSIVLIKMYPTESNYWGRIIGQSAVYTSIGIILFTYIVYSGKTIYNKQYWKFTLPIAIPTIFHLLAGIVLNQSDKVMLNNMVGNSAAGIYALACTFSMVLNTIWSAFNNSWVPFYYEYTRRKEIGEMKVHARNYIELFTIVSMGFILLAREVFHIYARQSFWEGTDLIPIFAIGYYFVFLYSFPVNYEFYNKKTKTIALGTTLAAVCNIILNYILIKWIGIFGAVLATAVAHGLQFGFHYFSAERINPGEFPFTLKDFIAGFCVVCVTCLFYWFTKETWIVRWLIGITIGLFELVRVVRRREIF